MPNVAIAKDSFFNFFDYTCIMHDAIDHTIVYEYVEMLKDLVVDGNSFSKGERFHQVNFSLLAGTFSFIVWERDTPPNVTRKPEILRIVRQSEIAPLLFW